MSHPTIRCPSTIPTRPGTLRRPGSYAPPATSAPPKTPRPGEPPRPIRTLRSFRAPRNPIIVIPLILTMLCFASAEAHADTGTYKLLEYRVTLAVKPSGTTTITCFQKWEVLSGHIPWITVGLPNPEFSVYPGQYWGDVAAVKPANRGSWSGVRIDLVRDYSPGETFEIGFTVMQEGLLFAKGSEDLRLDYTAAWYDRAVIDVLEIEIKVPSGLDGVRASPGARTSGEELIRWRFENLGPGARHRITALFPKSHFDPNVRLGRGGMGGRFPGPKDGKKGLAVILPVVIAMVVIILLAVVIRQHRRGGRYGGGGGLHAGGTGFHGTGCVVACACACVACACACACAGGGAGGVRPQDGSHLPALPGLRKRGLSPQPGERETTHGLELTQDRSNPRSGTSCPPRDHRRRPNRTGRSSGRRGKSGGGNHPLRQEPG